MPQSIDQIPRKLISKLNPNPNYKPDPDKGGLVFLKTMNLYSKMYFIFKLSRKLCIINIYKCIHL